MSWYHHAVCPWCDFASDATVPFVFVDKCVQIISRILACFLMLYSKNFGNVCAIETNMTHATSLLVRLVLHIPFQCPIRRLIVKSRKDSKDRVFRIVRSLWNFIGTLTAVLPTCLSTVNAMRWCNLPISQIPDFPISCDKTSIVYLIGAPAACRGRPYSESYRSALKVQTLIVRAMRMTLLISVIKFIHIFQ